MSLKISRILHAGYVFEHQSNQIAFDPIFENPFSQNCYAFPSVQFDLSAVRQLKLNGVFISHFHDDHCSLESLNLLDRTTPIYIYCVFEEILDLIRALGFTEVISLDVNVPVRIGSIEIIPRQALDADVDCLFQIRADGLNVLNVVDSWIDDATMEKLVNLAPWDMILWPFQMMREIEVLSPSRWGNANSDLPSEWLEQLRRLNPGYVVPSSCQFQQESWSWYNQSLFPISYKHFESVINRTLPNSKVTRLNPSVSILLDKTGITMTTPLGWVQPVGDQDVDYDYRPLLKPQSLAEIARHFQPLTWVQTKRVYRFLHDDLIVKYNTMEPPEDSYFDTPRLWQLSLYDQIGTVQDLFYRVHKGHIALLEKTEYRSQENVGWWTQISIQKIYAALENGESLSSLYIRINDVVFDAETEKEIQFIDTMEDPLVRCLFNGVFGEYQRAQLKKIRNC